MTYVIHHVACFTFIDSACYPQGFVVSLPERDLISSWQGFRADLFFTACAMSDLHSVKKITSEISRCTLGCALNFFKTWQMVSQWRYIIYIPIETKSWKPNKLLAPYIRVFPKIGGKPPKWMVKIMENPMNKWMIWGAHPYFWKHPYIDKFYINCLARFLPSTEASEVRGVSRCTVEELKGANPWNHGRVI